LTASSQPLNDVAGEQQLAQTFTPTLSGTLEVVDVSILKFGAPVGQVWLEVQADNAGVPSNTALAISDKLDIARFNTTQAALTRFLFRTPPTLVATTKYWLVMKVSHATDAVNYTDWRFNAAGTNQFYKYNGTTWTAITTATATYKTYITQNNVAVTMPTGWDEKCKIGWIYNNSGNVLNTGQYRDRKFYTLASAWASGNIALFANIGTLIDASVGLPPTPIKADIRGAVDTAGAYISAGPVPDAYGFVDGSAPVTFLRNVTPSADATNQQAYLGTLETEFQAFYGAVNVNHNGQFWIIGWEW
jgi:hypothetical protein